MIPLAVALPFLPIGALFGFVPLPGRVIAALAGTTLLYVVATELQKHGFDRADRERPDRAAARGIAQPGTRSAG